MRDGPQERALEVEGVLRRAASWAASSPGVRALALVGSYARGDAREDSDVDLVVLTIAPGELLDDDGWLGVFGQAELVDERDFGAIGERRLRLASGLEVEVGVGAPAWASIEPLDEGTEQVASDGLIPLYDPDGILGRLLDAIGGPAE